MEIYTKLKGYMGLIKQKGLQSTIMQKESIAKVSSINEYNYERVKRAIMTESLRKQVESISLRVCLKTQS